MAEEKFEFMAKQMQSFSGLGDKAAARNAAHKIPKGFSREAFKHTRLAATADLPIERDSSHSDAHYAHADAADAWRKIGEMDHAKAHELMSQAHGIWAKLGGHNL